MPLALAVLPAIKKYSYQYEHPFSNPSYASAIALLIQYYPVSKNPMQFPKFALTGSYMVIQHLKKLHIFWKQFIVVKRMQLLKQWSHESWSPPSDWAHIIEQTF